MTGGQSRARILRSVSAVMRTKGRRIPRGPQNCKEDSDCALAYFAGAPVQPAPVKATAEVRYSQAWWLASTVRQLCRSPAVLPHGHELLQSRRPTDLGRCRVPEIHKDAALACH